MYSAKMDHHRRTISYSFEIVLTSTNRPSAGINLIHFCTFRALDTLGYASSADIYPFNDQAANGSIMRANADLLVFSRSIPANQSETRSRLMAAAVSRC